MAHPPKEQVLLGTLLLPIMRKARVPVWGGFKLRRLWGDGDDRARALALPSIISDLSSGLCSAPASIIHNRS